MSETCSTCMWLKTFKPRADEIARFDWVDVGYGCKYPGYEGYTQPTNTCPSYWPRQPKDGGHG